jgi:ferredoxin-NADP reductase
VTREAPETWQGQLGRIKPSQLAPLIDDEATLCFVCGPETMVAEVPRALMELGIDRARVRLEEW